MIQETRPAEKPSLTYWQQVWRDFVANRLAMFGALVIGFVILVAVFCPLIANQKPLYIHAVFPFDYINSYSIVMEQIDNGAADREVLDRHLANMKRHLDGDERATVEALVSEFDNADAASLATVRGVLEPLADATLQPITRYPALRGLKAFEVFTIVAFLMCIVAFIFRARVGRLSVAALLVLGPSLFALLLWKAFVPPVHDGLIYRTLVQSEEFQSGGGRAIRAIVPYGENENIILDERQPPTWLIPAGERGPNWHWLGTDTNGRDVLARMVYGARVSMLIGIVAVSIYTLIGIVLGAVAGYYGGWTDILLSRFIEIVICFPALMLILAVQAFLVSSLLNIILALSLLWWTGVARLQRGEFLRLVGQDFVQGVRALGGSNMRIIFLHILPNALGPILVMVSFGIAGSILVESALSFLGFGVPQPMASWGDLLNNGRNDIKGTWWLTLFPGFVIFVTVTCFNLLGEGIRDALDPRR